jgi:hypothetical protein
MEGVAKRRHCAYADVLVSLDRGKVVPPRLQSSIPVPVLDGAGCAARQVQVPADLAPIKPQRAAMPRCT